MTETWHAKWCKVGATGKCDCGGFEGQSERDAEAERLFLMPINPDPITTRVKAEKGHKK